MKYCIINHRNKSVSIYARKLDAIYDHAKCKRGTGIQYKECTEEKLPSYRKVWK